MNSWPRLVGSFGPIFGLENRSHEKRTLTCETIIYVSYLGFAPIAFSVLLGGYSSTTTFPRVVWYQRVRGLH